MSHHSTHASRFPVFWRLWKPAVVTGAGGAALILWLDEIMLLGEEILALIFLPILAGVLYLLDIFIFKSQMPQRKDFENPDDRRARK